MTIIDYKVPEYNLRKLEEKVQALNRKAERLGTSPISLVTSGFEDFKLKDDWGNETGEVVRLVLVTLEGETPKLEGWRFIATLQHEDAGNIIRTVPGEELPEEYRINPQKCDHCRSDRYRKDTYVVANDNDNYAQVGSTCLKDFTGGNSPQRAAAYAEMIIELDEMFSGDDFLDISRPAGEIRFDLETVIAWTLAVIREYGWLPKSKAGDYHRPTAGWVEDALIDRSRFEHYNGFVYTDEDKEKALEIISWGREFLDSQDYLNDYQWNMSVTLETESILYRSLGLACSLVPMYWRETEKERQQEQKAQASNYVGQVGERMTFSTLTLHKVIVVEGYYGTTKIHKFTDPDGNEIVWFASRELLNEGEIYSGKATVKKHEEYNGIKQTVITRAKLT